MWSVNTIRTVILRCTTPLFEWPRISLSAICWLMDRATLALWTVIMLLRCAIQRSVCVRSPTSFWLIWTRKPLILGQITMVARESPWFFLQKCLICWLMAALALRWVWRLIYPLTTWMRSSQPVYMCFTTQNARSTSSLRSFLPQIFRPPASSMVFRASARVTAPAVAEWWCALRLTLKILIKVLVKRSSWTSCHIK